MLSIVIPSYKRADLLRNCLAAVVQHAPPKTEIIVVDDASADRAISLASSCFAGVRTIRLRRQSGFCVAANEGIRQSQGDIVELLNDDTEVRQGWAEAAMAWFEQEDVGSVAPLVLCWPDGRVVDSAGDCYSLGGVARKRGHGRPVQSGDLQARRVFGASGAAGFFRRSALDDVGLFPECFGAYFEDVDLAFRLQRAGWRTIFEPEAQVLHHVSSSYGHTSRRLVERQSHNEERVFWRNIPSDKLAEAILRHLAVLVGKALIRWAEGTLMPFVFGRLRLLGEIEAIRRHRRELAKLGPLDTAHSQIQRALTPR